METRTLYLAPNAQILRSAKTGGRGRPLHTHKMTAISEVRFQIAEVENSYQYPVASTQKKLPRRGREECIGGKKHLAQGDSGLDLSLFRRR
jgi:hypothetical protein